MNNTPFEDRIPEIQKEISKRRNKWTLSTLPWEDASSILMIRVFKKYNTFDETRGEFSHWLNRLISHAIKNLLRDNLGLYSRPCIKRCAFNLGGDFCGYTKSGVQCEECPLYAVWSRKKKDHFNVKQSLPLVNHEQEVNSIQSDFINIEESKLALDKKLKERLNPQQWEIYEMIYIKNLSIEDVGKRFQIKINKNAKYLNGQGLKKIPSYQTIKKIQSKIVGVAREILNEEGLV